VARSRIKPPIGLIVDMSAQLTLHTLAIVASEHLRRVVPVYYVTGGVETDASKNNGCDEAKPSDTPTFRPPLSGTELPRIGA
jgi:hypothetical protein